MSKKVAVFGGSFNPPGRHHRAIVEALTPQFDEVLVVPCGPRPDKPGTADVDTVFRATMADIAFRDLDGVEVDLFDLEQAVFSRTYQIQERFATRGELWHVVGTDLTEGGGRGQSAIHTSWSKGPELWETLNFVVVTRDGHPGDPADLPPHSMLIDLREVGSSSAIRERLFRWEPYGDLVDPTVGAYIERYGLYRGRIPSRSTNYHLDSPSCLIVFDERNTLAVEWAGRLEHLERSGEPTCILVIGGDGSMLRAIRQHWRLRLPFLGLNAGHHGFLLNDLSDGPDETFPPSELILRQLPLLYVEMRTVSDGEWISGVAFNDTWVERETGQTAWLDVSVNGKVQVAKLVCDGLLLSTAAGSTAYARAMGSEPLLADTPAWLLVGSNVMSPTWKSALLSTEAEVSITNLDTDKRPVRGFIDGVPIGTVDKLRARVSRIATAELAFMPEHDMAEKIAQLQFGPSA